MDVTKYLLAFQSAILSFEDCSTLTGESIIDIFKKAAQLEGIKDTDHFVSWSVDKYQSLINHIEQEEH